MQLRPRQTNSRTLNAASAELCFTTLNFLLIRGRGAKTSFNYQCVHVCRDFARRQTATSGLAHVFKRTTTDFGRLLRQHASAYRRVKQLYRQLANRNGSALGREFILLCNLMGNGYNARVLRRDSHKSERHANYGLTASSDVGRLLFAALQVLCLRKCRLSAYVTKDGLHRRLSNVKLVILGTSRYLIRLCHLRRGKCACRGFFHVFRRRLVINDRVQFTLCNISSSALYLRYEEEARLSLHERTYATRACSANVDSFLRSFLKNRATFLRRHFKAIGKFFPFVPFCIGRCDELNMATNVSGHIGLDSFPTSEQVGNY